MKADQPAEHTNYMKVGQDLQDDSGLQEADFVQLVSSYFVSIRVIRRQIKSERPAKAGTFR